MDTDNWINLIAAIIVGVGTLFLGIMAWRTICQTRNIQKADKRERILNEIIDWVSDIKTNTIKANTQSAKLGRGPGYEVIFITISDELLRAELMKTRAIENAIPVVDELDNVWRSAFFCSQLAARIIGNRPTDEQMDRWSEEALDIVSRIDELEKQSKLSDQEMYNGQRKLKDDISVCLKKLVKYGASL